MKTTRIALADDHPVVLSGLEGLIAEIEGMEVVLVAQNGRVLVDKMKQTPVDVVLLDIDMPELDGIAATRILRSRYPDVRIVVLTMHDEQHFMKRVIEEGAHGYLLKNCSKEELLVALRNVQTGKHHFSGEVTMKLAAPKSESESALEELTEREIEILTHIARGLSNKEIGDQLFISHRTVDTHRTNLMKKLGVHNIAGLIRFAYRNKLVE